MEQVAIISSGPLNRPLHPPPLPPKTRRPYAVVDVNMSSAAALECHQQTPPSATSTTVYVSSKTATNQDDLNTYHSFPEVEPNSNTANVVSNKQIESNSGGHVVKIQINSNVNDGDTVLKKRSVSKIQLINVEEDKSKSITRIGDVTEEESSHSLIVDPQSDSCIRINVGTTETEHQQKEEMIRSTTMPSESLIKTSNNERNNPYFFYSNINNYSCSPASLVMSSGQCSPSDTLDSGTCSDLDSTPPPLPKKKSNKNTGVSITVINGQHNRASSLTSSGVDNDSDDNESNISCDSLNSGELNGSAIIPISDHNDQNQNESEKVTETDTPLVVQLNNKNKSECNNVFLPSGLLQDIRDRSVKLTATLTQISDPVDEKCQGNITKDDQNAIQIKETKNTNGSSLDMTNMKSLTDKQVSSTTTKTVLVNESTYEERKLQEKQANIEEIEKPSSGNFLYDADRYYKFHLNENVFKDDASIVSDKNFDEDDDNFAGYKDFLGSGGTSSTIRSAKGTVRGVKNRVRAGIATFLQIQNTTKSYREKDAGKVVVYTTTMGIVRDTYQQCVKVKQILRTHLVKFEERDVFMSSEYQTEIRDRMHSDQILIPQLFVDGQHIGDAEAVERLNECGELRKLLKPYKSADACSTCQVCGGYRLLPCPVCNGSKKSVHRNHFTTEFVALKCMNCDEVGLVKCYAC